MTDPVTMRPIETDGYAALTTAKDFGPAAMLQWIRIADLVVDPGYQREIVGAGRKNVRRIAEAFSWSKFAPVIVSPVEGGRYAIVDGQHRTTAAALCGIESVPCAVVMVDRTGQAAAFKAINGVTTRMQAMAVYHAALLSGDGDAVAINDLCARAGVRILKYPVATDKQEAGDTLAVNTLQQLLTRHGRDVMVTALQCVTQTGDGNAGLLVRPVMIAIAEVLAENPAWCEAGSDLLDAFDEIALGVELEDATRIAAQKKNVSIAGALAEQLRATLSERLGPVAPAQEAAA